jgi:hypothetical protein
MATDTLGSRVDRLEASTSDLGRQVERVVSEQTHLDKMMTMRFTTLDTALAGISIRLEAMNTTIVTTGSDPAQTPGGRALLSDIADGKTDRAENRVSLGDLADRLSQVERRLWMAQGALALLLILLNLIGPSIRAAIGLP